jgi:integrase/recombinase XerD
MKSHAPTAEIVLDIRKAKLDSTYPLKLRITFNRIRRYFNVGMPSLSEEDFKKLDSPKLRDPFLKDVKTKIISIESKALGIFPKLSPFSFDEFEKLFFPKEEGSTPTNVYSAMESYIQKLNGEGRVTTASSYECTMHSLQKFKKKLRFEDITPDFLNSYERFMLANDKASTTVGIYLRSLRAIYNQAIEDGVIGREKYPFKKNKYQIPAGQNIKKALTMAELKKIFEYDATHDISEEKAKDFWIFSYLYNGINVKDICRLKYQNLDGDRLVFHRAKTENTKKSNQKPIVVYLGTEAKVIIEKWGSPNLLPSSYIFSILHPNITPIRERELVQNLTKQINKYMRRIVGKLGINKPVTTYAARHSFSTVLKRSGAPIEFISESLGHNNLKTTENYLDSFEDDVKKKYAESLTNFS